MGSTSSDLPSRDKMVDIITDRLDQVNESCNSSRIDAMLNQIRGMVWMVTGNDIGRIDSSAQVFDALGIPYRVDQDKIRWGDRI